MEIEDPADVFARLAVELQDASTSGVVETAQTLLRFAVHAIGCSSAGLALSRRGTLEVAAMSDPRIEASYRFQLDTGEGPLITAFTDQTVVWTRDAATDPRWPLWAEKVAAVDVRSVLQVPLHVGNQTLGVLGLHATEPDAFSIDDEAIAQVLARHAWLAVASARRTESLVQAKDARKVVGQAMGILMERFGVDEDRAFSILRRYSQDNNTKLRDVAQLLIDTRKLPTTSPSEAGR